MEWLRDWMAAYSQQPPPDAQHSGEPQHASEATAPWNGAASNAAIANAKMSFFMVIVSLVVTDFTKLQFELRPIGNDQRR